MNVADTINIPNVFTPDGDGINDVFYISNNGFKEFQIEIFNRWGVKVFESMSPNIKWDGRSTAGIELSEGTYYYVLKAISKTDTDYSTTGFISLYRNK